jgi:hypothetical protein
MSIISLINQNCERKTSTIPTEAKGTRHLQGFIYSGCGPNYLGYQFPDQERQSDGTFKSLNNGGYRFWKVPTEKRPLLWWNPVWDHLKGLPRGLVARNAHTVPFVAVDLDRHSATVPEKGHIIRVLKCGRLLKEHCTDLRWSCAEVNPRNGSAKFYGFTGNPIPIDMAAAMAKQIHDRLIESGCGLLDSRGIPRLEVFPFSSIQVGLPMRTDKTTIISAGVLPKCWRVRKSKTGNGRERFETYSALAFLEALQNGGEYEEAILFRELKAGCAQLPYQAARSTFVLVNGASKSCNSPRSVSQHDEKQAITVPESLSDYHSNPNSFERQQAAMLELCRRIRRVASVEEGLAFIMKNELFTGDWQENVGRRIDRVTYLLGRISQTFDPKLCKKTATGSEITFGQFDSWARTYAGTIRGKARHFVNEFGDIIDRENRLRVDWHFVSAVLSVLEHTLVVNPNEDGTLPERWAEQIWNSWKEEGRIAQNWNSKKWQATRDWLEEMGIIKIIDRTWRFDHGQGQAMKWEVTPRFHTLNKWWKQKKQPSLNDPMPLVDLLRIRKSRATPPLNTYPHTRADRTRIGIGSDRIRPPP